MLPSTSLLVRDWRGAGAQGMLLDVLRIQIQAWPSCAVCICLCHSHSECVRVPPRQRNRSSERGTPQADRSQLTPSHQFLGCKRDRTGGGSGVMDQSTTLANAWWVRWAVLVGCWAQGSQASPPLSTAAADCRVESYIVALVRAAALIRGGGE